MKIGSFFHMFCKQSKIYRCKLCSRKIVLKSDCYKIKFNKKEITICYTCLEKMKKVQVKKI